MLYRYTVHIILTINFINVCIADFYTLKTPTTAKLTAV